MRLKKQLGQYLLNDQTVVDRIIGALELESTDTILEIGPGTASLTRQLVKTAGLVLAVEKDFRMVERLRAEFKSQKSKCKIIHDDILKFDESGVEADYKLVGNLPYNITSPIIRKFLESRHKPSVMVLMTQKEVAERITAPPGSSERGILTLMIEYYGKAKLLFHVPRSMFFPVPKVDSAVVRIVPSFQLPVLNSKVFFRIIKAGFSAKRRQIHNSLAGGLGLSTEVIYDMLKQGKIDEKKRAEDLSFEDWQHLTKIYAKFAEDRQRSFTRGS